MRHRTLIITHLIVLMIGFILAGPSTWTTSPDSGTT